MNERFNLDYALQKLGPNHADIPKALREIDDVGGGLIDYFEGNGVRVVVGSEYGIEAVDDAVHINRLLRVAGGIRVRVEEGLELLDPGASPAFAVADHQVAHVYVRAQSEIARYADFCRGVAGVEQVLDCGEQAEVGLDHPRSGDLVLVAEPGRWFSYNYWLDDAKAPDFARTVDIHRKPGYDPVELFLDPEIRLPQLTVGWKLLKRKLSFGNLLDVIPLDPSLVRGSHGRVDQAPPLQPVLITQGDLGEDADELPVTAMRDVILDNIFRN